MRDEASRLHRKGEPRLVPMNLYSLMDMYGCIATCDECGNWQRIPVLSEHGADREGAKLGWSIGEKDYCPECVSRGVVPSNVVDEKDSA